MANRTLLCLCLAKVDPALLEAIAKAGWQIEIADSLGAARKKLQYKIYSAAFFIAESIEGIAYDDLDAFFQSHRNPEWVGAFSEDLIASQYGRELILSNFFDFHTLPADVDRLIHTLGHAHGLYGLRNTSSARSNTEANNSFVGESKAVRKLLRDIHKIANAEAPIMISGPSGSGKELAAQTIHRLSRRAAGPFIAINCSTLPASLIQSELFGHEKGAFSGAVRSKQGFIEAAAGGTIFLDEIGDIPIDLQTNLLRFLQEKTINRIGSTQLLHVDTRVIAASHVNLEQAVTNERFREDLYYRLNVLPLKVPSLSERREDILPLAEHFYALFEKERNPRLQGFGTATVRAMEMHSWPGNVRELLNRVRRAVVMAEGRLITAEDLGLEKPTLQIVTQDLDDARGVAEKKVVLSSLSRTDNNLTHAARELGVSRMTLYRLMEKHGIST